MFRRMQKKEKIKRKPYFLGYNCSKVEQASNFLRDLEGSRFPPVLKDSLINAIEKTDDIVFGLAMAKNLEDSDNKVIIENSIENLSTRQKNISTKQRTIT